MEYKDYYKILGVDKSATPEAIKKQYRKLARKYHPDVNPADKDAASRFSDINEANEVLSDSEKRKKYDTLGSDWKQYENMGKGGPFSNQGNRSNRASYSQYEGDIFSNGGFSDFFKSVFGDSFAGFNSATKNYNSKGRDYRAELEITMEEAYSGCVRLININDDTMRITLEAGLKDGQTIKLKGKGAPGIKGGGERRSLHYNSNCFASGL